MWTKRIRWAGLALQIAGFAYDLYWHRTAHELETADRMLWVHSGFYLGTIVMLVATAVAARRPAPAELAILGGLGVELTGEVWDLYEHSQLAESSVAHLLIYLGATVAVLTLAVRPALDRSRRDARAQRSTGPDAASLASPGQPG